MKAQNHEIIKNAIIKFTLYLVLSVTLTTCFFFLFLKTSSVEVSKILDKVKDYDKIQSIQLDLVEKSDSLIFYTSHLTAESRVNYRLLQNSLGEKRLQFSNSLKTLSEKDCLLYTRLASQMNIFFDTKDSLVVITSELNSVRDEYLKCQNENRNVRRRISLGGVTVR